MSIRESPDPDDPIKYYIKHIQNTGKAAATIRNYENSFAHLETFLNQRDLSPGEITDKECIEFIRWLRNQVSESTVGVYTSTINQFYQYFSNRGTFETNPMSFALDEVDISRDSDGHRREVSLEAMQDFVGGTVKPKTLTMVVLFAKSGIRRGELINLDLVDLHLDHPGAQEILPKPRAVIDDKPDSLFVSSEIKEGDVVRGDRRMYANKRKEDTIIPLDDELKQTFLYWTAIRAPSPTDAVPLFTMSSGKGTDRDVGERITEGTVTHAIRNRTKSYGWYTEGAGVQTNVTPHYFRHWFQTTGEDNGLSRPLTQYLRGDVGGDSADTYRHFWDGKTRKEYTNNIFKLVP